MTNGNVGLLEGLDVQLHSFRDERGLLTFAQEYDGLPFQLKRMFWITDVPVGSVRGGHAHKKCKQFICCLHGSFRLTLKTMHEKKVFEMNNPDYGIYIPEGVWCSLEDFTEGTVVLVGASEKYNREGYIRDWNEYVQVYG